MKGVLQSTSTNCVAACVASLFETTLLGVPNFDPEYWWQELDAWLQERGMACVNMVFPEPSEQARFPLGYTLGAIPTENPEFPADWKHCVVCFDGHVVWCPKRGEQDGTQRAEEYTILYPLDPNKR